MGGHIHLRKNDLYMPSRIYYIPLSSKSEEEEYTVDRTYEKKVDVKKSDFIIWGKRRIFFVIMEEKTGSGFGY